MVVHHERSGAIDMPFCLRYYQREAVDAIWQALKDGERAPVVCLPTGAGKTAVVAEMACHAVNRGRLRVLVLCHVKELIEQLASGIRHHGGQCGVWSAGLGEKTTDAITVAGIQSAYRSAEAFGRIDLIIIDEAHCVPPEGDGMYRTLISALQHDKLRIVGLTATPYRMTTGLIYGESTIFSRMVYDAGVRRLMDDGYLSRLRGKNGGEPDLSHVHKRGGEYIASELEDEMADEAKVAEACKEIVRLAKDRSAWLVFCCGIKHADMVSRCLRVEHDVKCSVVTGDTPGDERDDIIARYKARLIKCLINVNVLTTGFDAPHVDCVVLLRPTESPGLYYQMVGRGLRKADGKADCMVLDLAGNILRHGPIDTLNDSLAEIPTGGSGNGSPPQKTCPNCQEIILAALMTCPACGHQFERSQAKHGTTATELSPVYETQPPRRESVTEVSYAPWKKRGWVEGDPQTMCVTYYDGMERVAREWVCVEHGGYARDKALAWLRDRLRDGIDIVDTVSIAIGAPDSDECFMAIYRGAEAISIIAKTALRRPSAITLVKDGEYDRVTGYEWGDVREPGADEDEPAYVCAGIDDEPPF
jgi:DNA repair protein RadD